MMADAMKLVPEMIEAADRYIKSVALNGEYALPAMFNWHEMWSAMLAASPPAREEAPGETTDCKTCAGNGEIVTNWDEYLSPPKGAPADHATADCPDCDGIGKVEAPAEGAVWRPMEEFPYTGKTKPVAVLCDNGEVHAANWHSTRWLRKEKRYEQALSFFDHSGSGLNPVGWKPFAALRNRTSEPEAGAVAWRARMRPDGEWMVLDAEYVPGRSADDAVEVQPLYTHPAPATADKMKVAVEALEPFAEASKRLRPDDPDNDKPAFATAAQYRAAAQALATLNEEG